MVSILRLTAYFFLSLMASNFALAKTILPIERAQSRFDHAFEVLDSREEVQDPRASMRVTRVVKGRRGGGLIVVKKRSPDSPWYVENNRADFFRGNPEWIVDLFGSDLARFIGFRQISSTEFLFPNADETNLAFAELNSAGILDDPITLTFYADKLDAVPNARFNQLYISQSKFPLARMGKEAQHDAIYHIIAGFIHSEAQNLLRRQMDLFFKFDAFLKAKHPFLRIDPKLHEYRERVENASVHIDNFNTGLAHGLRPRNGSRSNESEFKLWVDWSVGKGASPKDRLREDLRYFVDKGYLPGVLVESFIAEQEALDPSISQGLSFPIEELYSRSLHKLEQAKAYAAKHTPRMLSCSTFLY